MKSIRLRRSSLTIGAVAITAFAIAGGIAYATIPGPDKVFTACMLKNVGTIRLIDKSLPATNLLSRCTDKEIEVSWNQAGQPGPQGTQGVKGEPGAPGTNGTNGIDGHDGFSVTSEPEPQGANCAEGGSKFTAANGVTYACNGAVGPSGPQGPPGTGGISSLTDLNGLACNVGPAAGTVHVAVDPTSGDVSLGCVITAAVRLTVTVTSHCRLPLGCSASSTETGLDVVAAGFPTHTCEVSATNPNFSPQTLSCAYTYASGTQVDLVPHPAPPATTWGGACAGETSHCALTLTTDSTATLEN
jgi:hypothetical protein